MDIKEIREIYILIAKTSSLFNIVPLLFLYFKGMQRRGLLLHLTWFYISILIIHGLTYVVVSWVDGRPYYILQHANIIRNFLFFSLILWTFVKGISRLETLIKIMMTVLISSELINIFFGEGLHYAKWALLAMNIYVIAVCITGIYFYSIYAKQGNPNRKSFFIIFISFLITFMLSMASDFFIPYLLNDSKPLYYVAFIFNNLISIGFEIGLICYAIYIFKVNSKKALQN